MPRRDGLGPMGRGAMTGRGMGYCSGVNAPYAAYPGRGPARGRGFGPGLGAGAGFGRGFGPGARFYGGAYPAAGYPADPYADRPRAEILAEEKAILEDRLKALEAQLAKEEGE